MRQKRVAAVVLPILFALILGAALADYLQAFEEEISGSAGKLVVVADTTASMEPELEALANAWPGSVIPNNPQERQFHLLQYKDQVRYEGSTGSVQQFQGMLNELRAASGGDCEDAMLQALAAAARGAPDSRALLLSDAAPMGGRSNFAFIMNKLVERGVNVYPVISGWCDSSELSQAAMFSLARMTGGVAYVHEAGETETAARSTLDLMSMQDTLLVENAALDGIKVYPLELDSTATTLGVDDTECKPVWCLTCTFNVQNTTSIVKTEDIKLMVKDPDGNLLGDGDPGVQVLETSGGSSFVIDVAQVYTPGPGESSATWEIIVQGSGDHVLNAVAESGVHLDYLGTHVLPAKVETGVRARLATEVVAPAVVGSSVQFAFKHVTNGKVFPIDLFDDGQHDDGQAGDGVFGGPVKARRGLWYLVARGELANGAKFERAHEVPIRVKGFQASKPRDGQQVAGSTSTLRFQISNTEENELNKVASKVYELSVESLLGWSSDEGVPPTVVLAPGETKVVEVKVKVPQDAAAGDTEETFLTVVESNDIGSSETLTVMTTVVNELKAYLPATLGN